MWEQLPVVNVLPAAIPGCLDLVPLHSASVSTCFSASFKAQPGPSAPPGANHHLFTFYPICAWKSSTSSMPSPKPFLIVLLPLHPPVPLAPLLLSIPGASPSQNYLISHPNCSLSSAWQKLQIQTVGFFFGCTLVLVGILWDHPEFVLPPC